MKAPFPPLLAAFLAVAPCAASAQQAPDDFTLLGAGLRTRPAYDGSNSQTGDLIPVVRYYGKPWFARTTQGILEGGVRAQRGPGFALGAQLAYEGGRETSESPFLQNRNAPDIDAGASVGLHAEWDTKIGPAPLTLLGRLRQHIDTDRGAQADARATLGVLQTRTFAAGLFAQATWANRKNTRAFYGAPGFDPGGGLLYLSAGVLGSLDLSRHWVVVASVEGRRLRGDAARSPLAERRSNHYASAGLAYRF